MKDVLKKIENNFNLSGEDSSFDILSGVIILKKSAECVFLNNWLKIKQNSGKYSNSSNDGKIDLIDINVDNDKKTINVSFIQVQNSDSMSSDKIKLFVHSAYEYLINSNPILEKEYSELEKYQIDLNDTKKNYPSYKIKYNFYISFNGNKNINTESKLKQYVDSLNLSNTTCFVYDSEKLNSELNEIKKISNYPKSIEYKIKSSSELIEYNNEKFKSITMLVDSTEICNIINMEFEKNIELNRLFNNNVRGFLEESDLNSSIKNTIQHYSNSFYYCNNGATIFCDDISKESNKEVHIVNPRIINGQQSIASIYLYDAKKATKILVKFIATKNDSDRNSMMNLLCLTTNSSNQIKPINLISNSKLFVEIKDFFLKKGINLSIKEGNLLNSIFSNNYDIDLEELLKIWVTLYLDRPDLAKSKSRIIRMFYKSELDEKKYIIFKNENAIKIVINELYESYVFYRNISENLKKFCDKEYYSHGKYIIIYMMFEQYNLNKDFSSINIEKINNKIELFIEEYKKEKSDAGLTYSLNNYFKGSRPLIDLNIDIKSELDYIDELSKKINFNK